MEDKGASSWTSQAFSTNSVNKKKLRCRSVHLMRLSLNSSLVPLLQLSSCLCAMSVRVRRVGINIWLVYILVSLTGYMNLS